ncbi:MAG: nitrous oxide reductase family maturation protein NosD, partial [Acidobacteriota bacterium]
MTRAPWWAVAVLVVAAPAAAQDMTAAKVGTLEGRPRPEHTSPLQVRLDAAAPGDTVIVEAGTYEGDLVVERPLTLIGRGRPVLRGSGTGSVVRVRAANVRIEGFEIDGRGGGDLGRDPSGIHVSAPGVAIVDCLVRQSLFGIYLREANGARVERSRIVGVPGRDPGEIGSGIHVWNTNGFTLTGNEIVHTRDGIYIQSATNGVIRGNYAHDLRYGLHYMFSDDNLFEDNTFENGAAGTALMYSRRITFRRNRFLRNRGFASVGLLFKACDDVVAEDNLIADNARGIFLEGSYRNVFRGNIVAMSDQAIVLYDSSKENVFEGNSFVANFTPLSLSGRRTDTRFEGNYWSDHGEPDLDGDGIADRPYRLSNVFDHLRGNLTAADLFAHGLAARALGAAERAFPVLDLVPVVDERPLARPPHTNAPTSPTRPTSPTSP